MNKPQASFHNSVPTLFLLTSLLGLCLVAALTFSHESLSATFPRRKPLIGSIFGSICLLGIIAGLSPSRCSQMLHFKTKSRKGSSHAAGTSGTGGRIFLLEGHHPNCGNFSAHVFRLRDKTFCAGCTGLILGAVMSIFGVILYFFAGLSIGQSGFIVFWFGFAGVALGLLQYNIKVKKSFVHLFLNVIFVFGAFLLLVGVDAVTRSFAVGLYINALSVFWVLTRIVLSQQEHRRICAACDVESCEFR